MPSGERAVREARSGTHACTALPATLRPHGLHVGAEVPATRLVVALADEDARTELLRPEASADVDRHAEAGTQVDEGPRAAGDETQEEAPEVWP